MNTSRLKQCVFVNSLPKSGTHLLIKTVELFGYREHFADGRDLDDPTRETPAFLTIREVKNALRRANQQPMPTADDAIAVGTLAPVFVAPAILKQWFAAMQQETFIFGHLMYSPYLTPLLQQLGFRHLCILRDPRAVVVSLINFILDPLDMPRKHFLHADFVEMSPQSRLSLILEGGRAARAGLITQDFATVYRAMLAWEAEPDCLVVRYEDLVGPQGGGCLATQKETVAKIAKHLGHSLDEVAEYFTNVYDPASRTFRRGQIDGWRQNLDADSLAYLNSYCAPLCADAGYA